MDGWYRISLITTGPTHGPALAAPVPVRKSSSDDGALTPKVGASSGMTEPVPFG